MINKALDPALEEELIFLRRYFHQHPELAYEEHQTSNYIAQYLMDCGLVVHKGLAGTGLIGILKGDQDGPVIGFRSDMDALPILEETDLEYKSLYPNKMHACGHDGHMAVNLVAAKILAKMRKEIKGTILFIFQPAEEKLPHGGAKRFLEDGEMLLNDLTAIFGFHFWPALETGKVAVSSSQMMAAGDIFEVTFLGIGAHGATPHQSSDVLMMASNAVLALTSITLRNIEPGVLATLSVTVLEGGNTPNVLPAGAKLKGTTRYLRDEFREVFPERIHRILEGICKAYNGEYFLDYVYGYPILQSDQKMAGIVESCAEDTVSGINVIKEVKPSLASEDFSVFLERTPGCYYWVGSQNNDPQIVNSLHCPKYAIDENALSIALNMILAICGRFVLV